MVPRRAERRRPARADADCLRRQRVLSLLRTRAPSRQRRSVRFLRCQRRAVRSARFALGIDRTRQRRRRSVGHDVAHRPKRAGVERQDVDGADRRNHRTVPVAHNGRRQAPRQLLQRPIMGSRPWRTSSLAADCPARVRRSRSVATAPALDRFRLSGYQLGRFAAGGRVRALGLEPCRRCPTAEPRCCTTLPRAKPRTAPLFLQFGPRGDVRELPAPPPVALQSTRWGISRSTRAERGDARVVRTLEDTPFYARSLLSTRLLDTSVVAVHESLSLDRFASRWVKVLLPFRMPRAFLQPALIIASVRQLLRARLWFREGASNAATRSVATRRTRGSHHRRTAIPI